MSKVIFLDIDGVLNNNDTKERTPMGFVGINPKLLKLLKILVDKSKADIILSSSWKDMQYDDVDYIYLVNTLKSVEIVIKDKTYDRWASKRGVGIRNYLLNHTDIEQFVILDDYHFDFYEKEELYPHFVQTDENIGLTEEDVNKAVNILNGNLDFSSRDNNCNTEIGYQHG